LFTRLAQAAITGSRGKGSMQYSARLLWRERLAHAHLRISVSMTYKTVERTTVECFLEHSRPTLSVGSILSSQRNVQRGTKSFRKSRGRFRRHPPGPIP